MVKVQTTVRIDEELRDLAKARNVSMSNTLNEALSTRLSVPNTMEELTVEKHRLKQELEAIAAKELELASVSNLKDRKTQLSELKEWVARLRVLWVKRLNSEVSDEAWAKAVSDFSAKWAVERAVTIQYAEGRKEVGE